jgi:hypothetical protein
VSLFAGTYFNPAPTYADAGDVRLGTDRGDGTTGTLELPDVSDVRLGTQYGADGTELTGTMDPGGAPSYPSAADVRSGTNRGDGTLGTLAVPSPTNVLSGVATDNTTGSLTLPSAANVRSGTAYGVGGTGSTGTAAIPTAADVRLGTATDATTGTLAVPTASQVLDGVAVDATTGNVTQPAEADVEEGVTYGANGTEFTGTLDASGGGGSSAGPGADQVTLNFTNTTTGLPIADADVWVTIDAAGAGVVAGTLQTDSAGDVTFLLDAGVTYYAYLQKDGVNPILGESFVAAAD